MSTAVSRSESRVQPRSSSRAIVVADANWYTTENLFSELDQPGVRTLLLKCLDYYNAWQAGRAPWRWHSRLEQRAPRRWNRDLVLPSGWMKRFPRIGMRPIRTAISAWREQANVDGPMTLVMTYPHYLFLRDLVRPDVQVYFNLDDYAHYWPRRAAQISRLEHQAVQESDLTVCVSRRRADQLRGSVPEAADRIRHLPHGTPSAFLAPSPVHRPHSAPADLSAYPRPYLGYVGSLEDRIDWNLLHQVSESFPNGTVVLVGRPKGLTGASAWNQEARRCLRRPNVKVLGWRPQAELKRYIECFDACMIPYRTDHPFNQACCPTKIMDYMGSGRPIVSTSLPECRLYPELLHLADDHEVFIGALEEIIGAGSDDGRAALRHSWAAEHTCAQMARAFLDCLPS